MFYGGTELKNYIICHYNNNEYLYDLDKKNYYLLHKKISAPIKVNKNIKERLKKISVGYEWRLDKSMKDILEKTYIAHSMRQHYRFDLYQTPVLPETAVRRACQVDKKAKKVVLVGDDDLVSVSLALMGHEVTVVDADEYLIDLIKEINRIMGLNIEAICCNFLNAFDASLQEKFDIMFTDPVSTEEGYKVFVKRGFELLKKNGEAFITVTERFRPVLDDFLNKHNLRIIKVYNAFCNSYNHKIELIDDVADMIKIQKTNGIKFESINSEINFFQSQNRMKLCLGIELFEIDSSSVDKQIQKVFNNLSLTLNRILQINKFISSQNVYYFLYDNADQFKIVVTIYDSSYVEINISSIESLNIGAIKKILLNNISYQKLREENYVCGLSSIKGHIDMDINCLN